MIKIAVLLTCHNRKKKTIESLKALYSAREPQHSKKNERTSIDIAVFLTDDGCTDGTSDAVIEAFEDKNIHILKGSGDLYWAGGMRMAWREAMKRHSEWDYYLLLNDDTIINPQCFYELFNAEDYSIDKYGVEGIVSGITCATDDPLRITYGGDVILNKITCKSKRLGRSSNPQLVDITNANILLVPKNVVDKIGIFYDGFIHGRADNDYAMLARKNNIPVLITAGACGECDNDHVDYAAVKEKLINMSIAERKAYYHHPLHSFSDFSTYIRRNMPVRYPFVIFFHFVELYFPKIYYFINTLRGM